MNKKCVLFIHGLGSCKDKTWGDLEKILNEKKNSTEFSEFHSIDFKYHTYESDKFTSLLHFSRKAIETLLSSDDTKTTFSSQINKFSKSLRSELSKGTYSHYDSISIVAHSMGGVITANYILNELNNKRTPAIDRVLYICTPFVGSVFADIAKKLRLNSQESGELSTKSPLLKELMSKVNDIESAVSSTYVFGDRDDVINECDSLFNCYHTSTLKGDHTSILASDNLKYNYEFIENFILNKGHSTFIENLYERAKRNEALVFGKKFCRKIESSYTDTLMYKNHLENYLSKNNNDHSIYLDLMDLISGHHFTPHEPYLAEMYYVQNESNEGNLDELWKKIISGEHSNPYFYIGPRGSGKTITQNIWIMKHFSEMENNHIFHVRCDVHKIYHAMRKSSKANAYKNISIEDYLDMQFLYVFLKYRSSKFNKKGLGKQGVESRLIKSLYDLLDLSDSSSVKNGRFESLEQFLDFQSNNILHNEENLRRGERKYSYAVELMGNITSSDDINVLLNEINYITKESIVNARKFPLAFESFFGILDEKRKNESKDEIIKTIANNIKEDEDILKSDLMTTLLKINKNINSARKNTTEMWLSVSKHIQRIATANNYKILRIIDGIDNIIVQDSTDDKSFFRDKIEELSKIKNAPYRKNVFYFTSLRDDSFLELQDNLKKYEINSVDVRDVGFYKYYHADSSSSIKKILEKRLQAVRSILPPGDNVSLYIDILTYVFNKYNHPSLEDKCEFKNIRAILRHHVFLSLHCLFEFKRTNVEHFAETKCKSILDKNFEAIFFLRNKLYISTEETTGDTSDYKYKVFPNLFYTHHRHDKWTGLCRLRIIQLLTNARLGKSDIIEKLSCLYPSEYIEIKIENLLNYNLIETGFNTSMNELVYTATYKANYLLGIISRDLNSIYFLGLDTPLPEKYVNEEDAFSPTSYLSMYKRKVEVSKNTGYGNSIVKSVTTFLLFIKHIHELELRSLRKSNMSPGELKKFCNPLRLPEIEKAMIEIFRRTISNHEIIKSYFKHVGEYKEHDLETDLLRYGWMQKGI